MDVIRHNLLHIQRRIAETCRRCGRDPAKVRLLAVSKTRSAGDVRAARSAGQALFGENRVMEARDKIPLVGAPQPGWHLIGPLQRNKVKVAVQLFDMIHSIDSLRLAETVHRHRDPATPLPILLQVNIGREAQKQGLLPGDVEQTLRAIASLTGLTVRGLMAIPPRTATAEGARPYLQALASMAERFYNAALIAGPQPELSMGMSHDFDVAIEEGATLVRVGQALFGPREVP